MDVKVSDSVYLAINDYGANVSCIALDDELVFFDAGMMTSFTREFRARMEKHFNRKASTLVFSHAHIDHFLGMAALNDCEVIAASATKPRVDRFLSMVFDEDRLRVIERIFPFIRQAVAEGELRSPTIWVDDEAEIKDGLRYRVYGGHSACSSALVFEDENILLSGDLVQATGYPYFGEPDTDMLSWIETLDTWAEAGFDAVVPGHGPVVDDEYVRNLSGFFKELLDVLRELKDEGVSIDEIPDHPGIPEGFWGDEYTPPPAWGKSLKRAFSLL